MAFTSMFSNTDIWSLPVSADEGQVTGRLERLTDNPAEENWPFVTSDGGRLVYASTRKGNSHIWLMDLSSGRETQLTAGPGWEVYPVIDPTGSFVAYSHGNASTFTEVRLQQIGDTIGKTLWKRNSGWGPVGDWSPGGGEILFTDVHAGAALPIWALDVAAEKAVIVLEHPEKYLFQGHFTPDGLWIAFNATSGAGQTRSEIFLAPYRKGHPTPEIEWIPVTDGWGWDDKPRWSPDGSLLYFTSDRDGFRCIWKQKLEPRSKVPAGDPQPLHHFHNARRSPMHQGLAALEMSVAHDKIILNLGDETGNIWISELEERR
ncbi:MAG: PD40 domain-containing protein [Planctomycetes bacterium]|nr:PD40 domain-containing protein [Planctomycetota bacterium]